MAIKAPRIDSRRYSQMLQQIRSLVPFYTPEWNAANDNDFGQALLHIVSHLTEDIIGHLNRVPRKNFIAFLNMLGIELLPARPARVPVRFVPAPGIENGFLIPENTRLIAGATEERQEELPFETEESLFAIRSALLSLVGVDPENDAIFLPPQDFMELELPTEQLPDYNMVSFSDAGSKTFQLDRVEGLDENDILRIPPSHSSSAPQQNLNGTSPQSSAEHLVVSATSGNIVTTKDKISLDYPANTAVEKVTRFHLFDSKDWQEHVLYLGHPDLFSIKNEAQFTVIVAHSAGPAAGIEPLDLAWEYWGEKQGEEEEDWWEFDIQVDGSNGFSRDGDIVMIKGKGEIKETKINGSPSRWIRCRLKDKIPSTEPRFLPKLDHIKFLIKSVGDPVPADQAFYNDTPLDVNLPFFPFGNEPRTLDRFQFASEEIFSKKGAEITVDIELDSGGILASTAAVVFDELESYQISVFARGTGGRLLEVQLDTEPEKAERWIDHEFPDDTAIAYPDINQGLEAKPAVVKFILGGKRLVWVFLTADNGSLIELFCVGEKCQWINHGRPEADLKIKGDPSAVRSKAGQITVFVTGENGALYRMYRGMNISKGKWHNKIVKPPGTSILSAPEVVVSDDGKFKIIALVNGRDNSLYRYDSGEPDEVAWTKFTIPNVKIDSKPFAKIYRTDENQYFEKIFFKDIEGNLYKIDTRPPSTHINLGKPSSAVKVESSASGFILNPAAVEANNEKERMHIFVRGSDNHLWERTDDGWEEHPPPSGSQLRGTPCVLKFNDEVIRVYSASAKNSILEKQMLLEVLGTASIGSAKSVTIGENASSTDDFYKDMYIEILKDDNLIEKREIIAYIGALRLVKVASEWSAALSDDLKYKIIRIVHEGKARSTTIQSVELDDNVATTDDAYNGFTIKMDNQERIIVDYQKDSRKAVINFDWYPQISISKYEIIPDHSEGTAAGGSQNTIILEEKKASPNKDAYVGLRVRMRNGDLVDVEKKIISYDESTKEATVDSDWDSVDSSKAPGIKDEYELISLKGEANYINSSKIRLAKSASYGYQKYVDNDIEIIDGAGTGQRGKIIEYDGFTKIATVFGLDATKPFPEKNSEYLVVNIEDEGQLAVGTKSSITLDSNASEQNDAYVGRTMKLTSGDVALKVITDYLGPDRVASINPTWDTNPASSSTYSIESYALWNEFEDPSEIALAPELSWEYWNDLGWVAFREQEHKFKDETRNLMISGKIEFSLPEDIAKVDVSGQESNWIRARIVSGDYGKETFTLEETQITDEDGPKKIIKSVPTKSAIRPPQIISLTISYKLTEEQFPKSCLTFNNLNFVDQTDACQTASKWFPPFVKLEDLVKTIYLGFEDSFEGSPIKLLFAAKELKYTEEQKPKLAWSFRTDNKWEPVSYKDATDGLIRQEILQLQIPRGFEKFSIFGQSSYWIKGSLKKGRYDELPVLSGIFPNTTWTMQAETILDEILGSSNGEEKQDFQFNKLSVLDGEQVRVLEVLSQEETEQLEKNIGPDAIVEEKDELDRVVGTWVLWKKVAYFFDSKPEDRHYKLDRAVGLLEFGDGIHGQIPPAGQDNIRAFSYQAGGGAAGNILAGEIQTLSTAIAGVESVVNPVAADGGADKATLEDMLDIGPGIISHRRRAVTIEDFELLAFEASRKIKKVRCLPNTNNNLQPETGWVTVIIVPESKDDKPQPSLVLRREVQRYLAERSDGLVANREHIYVVGPIYEPIDLEVDIYAESIDVASEAENQAREILKKFFHPLTGGPQGIGWEFGRGLALSDIYAQLEGIPGVDHIENLRFAGDSVKSEQVAKVAPNSLLAGGSLTINMKTAENK
jgi:hypothetical protein